MIVTAVRLTYLVCMMLLAAAGVNAAVPPGAGGRASRPTSVVGGPAGRWDDRFNPPGPDGEVMAIATIGGDLYIGGNFTHIGNLHANHIARWDGHAWFPLEQEGVEGVDGIVTALLADGDSLFVGGAFTRAGSVDVGEIAVWHPLGRRWSTLAGGVVGDEGGSVAAMVKHGTDLFVAGRFTAASTILANNIARWDGARWSRLGGGITGQVSTMTLAGSQLYVGGLFTGAGDQAARNIACWDIVSGTWSALGLGVDSIVKAIAVHDNDVYVGGHFGLAGEKTVRNMAVWNTAARAWSPFPLVVTQPPLGLDNGGYDPATINAIVVDGSDLYIAGLFRLGIVGVYGVVDSVRGIVRWNLDAGRMELLRSSLISYDASMRVSPTALCLSNGVLYVGGTFPTADYYTAINIAALRLSDLRWLSLGSSINGLSSHSGIASLLADGKQVYVGGLFSSVAGHESRNVIRWDGSAWQDMGGGVGNGINHPAEWLYPENVHTMIMFNGDLIAGGRFDSVAGQAARALARWDGARWSPLGPVTGNDSVMTIEALAVAGNALYVAATVHDPSNLQDYRILRLDGDHWTEIARPDSAVRAFAVVGDQLYIAGRFRAISGVHAGGIARYDIPTGTITEVGGGVDDEAFALLADEHGIWVGGHFLFAGNVEARGLAYWDGSTWSRLDEAGFGTGTVYTLGRLDGDLVVGGKFFPKDGAPASNLALWDGTRWWPLGDGTDNGVHALVTIDNDLYVGGDFSQAGTLNSYYFARWTKEAGAQVPVLAAATPGPGGPMITGMQPNPVAGPATVQMYLPHASYISLALFDLSGRKVAILADREAPAGLSTIDWSAEGIADGAYLCRLVTAGGVVTSRVVIGR
jgi:hypothetical protein